MANLPQSKQETLAKHWLDVPSLFDVNRLFNFNGGWVNRLPEALRSGQIPPVNVAEDEAAFTVTVEIPGMTEKDINVQLMGNELVISGEKKFEEEKKDKEYHRVEAQYGSFSRTIALPREVRTAGVAANYKNGVLTVKVPKEQPTPASRIEVKPG